MRTQKLVLPALVCALACVSFAQGGPAQSNYPFAGFFQAGAPSGTCPGLNVLDENTSNGNLYTCPTPGGSWVLVSGSGSGLPTPAPTTPNIPFVVSETPSGGVAGTAGWTPAGIIPRASVCTSNVDAILSTDRGGYVSENDASACAVSLAQAGTTNFANNFFFDICAIGAGTVTVTPTTSTISFTNGSAYTSAASSMALTTGICATVFSDNTNYFAMQYAGGGSASSILTFFQSSTSAYTFTTTTAYFFAAGHAGTAGTPDSTEGHSQWMAPYSATVQNLRVRMNGAPTAGTGFTFTLRDNGSDTALTCSWSSGQTCVDTTHTVAVTAGDLLDIKEICTTGTGSCSTVFFGVNATLQY